MGSSVPPFPQAWSYNRAHRTRETAATVMGRLVDAGTLLAMTIEDVRPELTPEEFRRFTRFVGEILGSIQLDVMAPIIREHPDLDPDRE